jgi:hypothetical protein
MTVIFFPGDFWMLFSTAFGCREINGIGSFTYYMGDFGHVGGAKPLIRVSGPPDKILQLLNK